MKPLYLLIIAFLPLKVFSQEIYFPFHSGECNTIVERFYKKGFEANSCQAMEDWTKELPTVQNGSCQRVFNFAQVKQKDGSQVHPLSIILEDYKAKVARFGCEGEASGNGTSSARTQPQKPTSSQRQTEQYQDNENPQNQIVDLAVNTVFGLLGAGGSNNNNASREIANLKRTINNSLSSNSRNYDNSNSNTYRGLNSSTNNNSSSNTYKSTPRKPTANSYNNAGSTIFNNNYNSNTYKNSAVNNNNGNISVPAIPELYILPKSDVISPQGDMIYKTDGSQIVVKIIEIDETKIKYKNVSIGDNYIYSVNVKDVEKIVYSNGFVENMRRQ